MPKEKAPVTRPPAIPLLRAQYLISQALYYAIREMEKETGRKREQSNIDDMKQLREQNFPMFIDPASPGEAQMTPKETEAIQILIEKADEVRTAVTNYLNRRYRRETSKFLSDRMRVSIAALAHAEDKTLEALDMVIPNREESE